MLPTRLSTRFPRALKKPASKRASSSAFSTTSTPTLRAGWVRLRGHFTRAPATRVVWRQGRSLLWQRPPDCATADLTE